MDRIKSVYVLFVDLMGFADGIATLSQDELEELADDLIDADRLMPKHPLKVLSRYSAFHRFVNSSVGDSRDDVKTVIEFSDSAFIVLNDNHLPAEHLAMAMMHELMLAGVPSRIGIGKGTFSRMSFATEMHPTGTLFARAPFMGTGIINAYRAERCASKGFRIFVHPSAIAEPTEEAPWVYLPVADAGCSDTCSRELNFLLDEDQASAMRNALAEMRSDVTDPHVLLHYDATAAALDRFEAALRAQRM